MSNTKTIKKPLSFQTQIDDQMIPNSIRLSHCGQPHSSSPSGDNSNISDKAEVLKNEINDLNTKFNNFLTDVISSQTMKLGLTTNEWNYSTKTYEKQTKRSDDSLPDRVFVKRNSLLTDMFKLADIRTIRHVFIAILFILILQVYTSDTFEKGKIEVNFDLIKWCFGKSNIVFYTWICMKFSTTVVVYYAFYNWSNNRDASLAENKNKSNYNNYDVFWLVSFIVYVIAFLTLPALTVINCQLPIASSMIVLGEQLRLMMKAYAFVRTNVPRVLSYNSLLANEKESSSDIDENNNYVSDQKEKQGPCPSFSCYLYFLFVPTLVYRDSYPRTSRIRWNHVFTNFAHFIGGIFYTYYIFQRFCIPEFRHFNTEHVTLKMFITSILNCILPGGLLILIGFYSFLHCWMNTFAEMLRFGDRMFYRDWWNSTNYSNYYRTWNVVVHDWLYQYIYREVYMILGKNYKTFGQFFIFITSAIFHEYILTLAFGFFYPVLCLLFGTVGFLFMFIKPTKNSDFWNFVFWLSFVIGFGLVMCLYSIEWYARQNCPKSFDSNILDYIIPRSFTCGLTGSANNRINQLSKSEL